MQKYLKIDKFLENKIFWLNLKKFYGSSHENCSSDLTKFIFMYLIF